MILSPFRVASLCIVALCAVPLVTGCAELPPPRDPGTLAIVVGGRSNMPAPQLNDNALEIVRESVLSKDQLHVIGVSGNPRSLHSEPINQDCDSQSTCNAAVRRWTNKVQGLVSAVKADSQEANTLEAIAQGARSMAGNEGLRQILVIDSGLQTIGELPLQTPGALANAEEIATLLHDNGRLEPDLQGVRITFTGLGQVAMPQPDLPQQARGQLHALWETVLRAAGAEVKIEEGALVGLAPDPTLPPVTVVNIDSEPVISPCTPIREDQVGFLPNKAEFRDRNAASAVLGPIAKKLASEGQRAELIGTTALPEANPGPDSLSSRRAEAVKDVLIELGVAEASLTTRGVGTDFAAYPKPPAPPPAPAELAQYRLVYVQIMGSKC